MATSGITVSLLAKIEGWQAELKRIQDAAKKINIGSLLGRDLLRYMSILEKQINDMSKNLTLRFTSDVSIDRFNDKLNDMELHFRDIGDLFSQISFSDLDTEYVNKEILELTTLVTTLKTELNASMNEGFLGALTGATLLEKALARVNIDPKKLNFEEIKTSLENIVTNSTNEVKKLNEEFTNLKNNLSVFERQKSEYDNMQLLKETDLGKVANSIISKNASDYGFGQVINDEAVSKVRTKLEELIEKIRLSDEKKNEIKKYLNDLVPTSSVETIRERMALIQLVLSGKTGLADFGLSRNDFSNYLDEMITLLSDTSTLNTALNNIKDSFKQLGITDDDVSSFIEPLRKALSNLDFSGAISIALTNLTRLLETYLEGANKITGIVEDLNLKIRANLSDFSKNNWTKKFAENGLAEYEDIIKLLLELNRIKTETINKLEEIIKGKKEGVIEDIRLAGRETNNNSKSRLENDVNAIKMYKSELDLVHAREQLIGKLLGVVQRWFSIYAAVRMVNNAIRSIVATTRELDKTITEIAIVTDMSQADLWKLMPQYTDMARKYAASIPGTYQVSLLYYQQGLSQEDVMALTEETLKMARISGLDYADATDYMTNAVRSFKMEMQDASKVVDVYSAIAASSATNVTELASAMSKTASSAQAVGSSFENTTAMMAVMIEATRESAENIGSAMKSIISRYGEMTSDPSKLMDSEGLEMSLNRVDKALLTVGISIHNAAGEFRNFDEVIMELAENWDTIDTNTLRYIATIMAGNRQQSRFLALVSSYDRLKLLSEEAANSEDAALAQFLKTLDSVEAKTQLLLTSLLSLYVNTGILDVYERILDLANGIITSFSNMPRIFNLPIPAILKIGTVFYSVASSVTTIFGLLKYRLTNKIKELSGESTATVASAEANLTSMLEAEITKRIALLERYYTYKELRAKGVSAQEAALYAVETLKLHLQLLMLTSLILLGTGGSTKTGSNLKSFFTKDGLKSFFAKGSLGAAIAGIVGNLVGSALTMAASAMGESTQGERTTKGLLTIGGGALRGAGIGASFGPYGILIGGAIGALTSSLEGIGIIIETLAEKLKRLKDEALLSNNTRIEANTKYNNIKSEIDEVRKLTETYQDSAEAKAEYYEHSDALAELYPLLVASYDAEGHAIIDLTKAYEELAAAARDAKEATEQNNLDNIEVSEEEELLLKDEAELSHRNAVYTKYTERGVYFTKEDLEKAQLTDKKNKELLANELEQKEMNWADVFANFIKSYEQESIEALDAENYEAGILNSTLLSIMNGYSILNADFINNLFSNDDAVAELQSDIAKIKDTTLKLLLQYFINSMTGFQEVLTPEEAEYESKKAERIANQKTAVIDETKARVRELLLEAAYNNGPEVDYLSEFNTISTIINDSIYDMLEEAVQDAEKNNQTINTAEWFRSDEIDLAYTDLFNNLLYFWNSLTPDELSDFNNLIAKRGYMSRTLFILALPLLKEDGTHSYDWILQLLDYYEDAFDYEQLLSALSVRSEQKNNNQAFDNIIEASKDTLSSLGDIELHKVLSLYDNLNKKVASETVSQEDANEIFSLYISAFEGLSEEVQSILTNLDIFSFGDVADAITLLSSEEFDLEEVAPAIAALQALSHKIPINLNTEVSSLIDKFNKGLDDFEKSIKNATKGMNFKTMTEEAEKLGLEFSDFSLKDGKYYIDDYIKLSEQLIKDLNSEFLALSDELDARAVEAKTEWHKTDRGPGTAAKALNISTETYNKLWEDFTTDTQKTSDNIIDYYFELQKKKLTTSAGLALQYANDVLARSALESGRLQDFAQLAMGMDKDGKWIWEGLTESDLLAILAAIASGDISKLTDELKAYYAQYNALIISTYGDILKNIANSLFDALNSGNNRIVVTETNKIQLQALMNKGWIKSSKLDVGGYVEAAVDVLESNEEDFMLFLMSTYTTLADKIKAVKERHEHLYENTAINTLNQIADKLTFSYNEYIDYLASIGYQGEDLTESKVAEIMKDDGLKLTATGEVIVDNIQAWIEELTTTMNELSESATIGEKNNLKAKLDTANNLLNKTRDEVSKKLLLNYKSFSSDELEDFATAFEKDYDIIKSLIAISNGNGTYRLNVNGIQQLLRTEELAEETRKVLNELLASISDEYFNNISGATSYITKGTTKQSDMQTFVNDLNTKLNTTYNISDIFQWDSILDAFTLKPEYFLEYIQALKDALKADGFSADYIENYIKGQEKVLASLVNFLDFINAENNGEGTLAYNKLKTLLTNYYEGLKKSTDPSDYYQLVVEIVGQSAPSNILSEAMSDLAAAAQEFNENIIGMTVDEAIATISGGGAEAVDLAQKIALASGKELTAEEMQEYFAPLAKKYSEMAELIPNLIMGQYVGEGDFRDILTKAQVVDENGLVVSLENLALAYYEIYNTMSNLTNATVALLNTIVGQYLDVKNDRAKELAGIDALGNAISMTYSLFAEIYSQLGKELTESMVDLLMSNGTIKSLGGNKMMITDFDSFATSLGIKSNTIEYTSALKTYNDSLIEFNNRIATNISDEFTALSEVDLRKGTQLINLTNMAAEYGENIMEMWAEHAGAVFENGILTVTKNTDLTKLLTTLGKVGVYINALLANEVQAIVDLVSKSDIIDKSEAITAIISNYKSLSIEGIRAFADAFGITYEKITSLLIDNNDGTYLLDLSTLRSIVELGKEAVGEATYLSLLKTISSIYDDILGAISGAAGYVYQGTTNFADMLRFANDLANLTGQELNISELFSYDTILNTFTLNSNALKQYIQLLKEELIKLGYSGKAIDEYIKDQTVTLMLQNMNIEAFLNAQGTTAKSREGNKLAVQIVDWMRADGAKLTNEALLIMAKQWINLIELGGILAIDAIKAIKGENATTAELEAAFNNSQIVKLRTAMDDLGKEVGETISGMALNIMRMTSGFEVADLDDGTAVITAVGDMVEAYANLYAAMKSNVDATIGDLNSAYAKLLNAADLKNIDTLDVLENAAGMTYDAFAEILTRYDKTLEDALSHHFAESDGFGKVRITDFNAFAHYMNFDINSPEYAEAYSNYIDSMIELLNLPKLMIQNMTDSIKGLVDAKSGDLINAAYIAKLLNWDYWGRGLNDKLTKLGAHYYKGILTLHDDVDISALISEIANEAAQTGQLLPEQLAELADAVADMIAKIASLIKGGISGTLSNVDAQSLDAWARLHGFTNGLDFTETKEGLKLSNTEAIKLYNTIKEIDSLLGLIVFDELNKSLEENNEHYKSITDIMSRIVDLNNKIGDEKVSDARRELYEAELELAKEILAVRSTTEDSSFNFMSNKIPGGQNNPLNYFENWSKAFKAMQDAAKGKGRDKNKIAYEDYYNIITELGNLSAQMGGKGIQLGKDFEVNATNVAQMIEKGAAALSVTADGSIKVDLSKLGIDFAAGSKDLKLNVGKGIQAIAKSQVDMLDSMIALLETIVAMEALGDVDANGDMKITLPEIAIEGETHIGEDDLAYITKFTDEYKIASNKIIETFTNSDNELLQTALDLVKVNGHTMKEILSASELDLEDWHISADLMTKIVDGLYQLSLSDNYNVDDVWNSFMQIFSGIDFGDAVISVNATGHEIVLLDGGDYSINWDSVQVKSNLEKAIKNNATEYKTTEELQTAALEAWEKYKNNETLTIDDNYTLSIVTGEIRVTQDKDNNLIYSVGGKAYPSKEAAALAAALVRAGANAKDVIEVPEDEGETTTYKSKLKIGSEEIEIISDKDGNITYHAAGGEYTSREEAIKALAAEDLGITYNQVTDDQLITYKKKIGVIVDPLITLAEDTSSKITKEVQDKVRAALDSGDGALLEQINKDYNLGITFNPKVTENLGSLSADELNSLYSAFGIESKTVSLDATVTASGNANLITLIDEGSIDATIETLVNKDTAEVDLEDLKEKVEVIDELNPTIIVDAQNNATSVIDLIQEAINNLHGKTVLIQVEETVSEALGNLGLSKGTIGLALASGTLMGELGPELVVSQGRYFVVGLGGPEFVNLADDAIVFNHLLTQSLLEKGMSTSRGKAVTNERKAVAFALGNINGGPAMSSASSALAVLKLLRALWNAILNMTAQDFAALGGSGGGGGGGGNKAFIKELEKWYNWLQRIATLEKEINYEESRRNRITSEWAPNGEEYYLSLVTSYEALLEQLAVLQDLTLSQEAWFNRRREEMNAANNPFTALYTFDSHGQILYGAGMYDLIMAISGINNEGKPNKTPKEQYDAILALNPEFANFMKYDSSGNPIKEGDYAAMVQAFFDKMDKDKEEMESLYGSIEDGYQQIQELQALQNEILREMRDNQIELELKVYDAIVEIRLRMIDELTDTKDAIKDSNDKFIKGLSDALTKEQNMYNNAQSQRSLDQLRRRRDILMRSGGSAAEIASLNELIADLERSVYFDKQLEQIDAILEASDKLIEKLEAQILLETELLEYQKKYGLLWAEVTDIMSLSPELIADFIALNTESYWNLSPVHSEESMNLLLFGSEQWAAYRDGGVIYKDIEYIAHALGHNSTETTENNSSEENGTEGTDTDTNPSADENSEDLKPHGGIKSSKYKADGAKGHYWIAEYNDGTTFTSDLLPHEFPATIAGAVCKKCKYKIETHYTPGDTGSAETEEIPSDEGIGNATKELQNMLRITLDQLELLALYDSFINNMPNPLANLLSSYNNAYQGLSPATYDSISNTSNSTIRIDKVDVNLNVDELANDYDSRLAANTIMDEMLRIASKTKANNSVRR